MLNTVKSRNGNITKINDNVWYKIRDNWVLISIENVRIEGTGKEVKICELPFQTVSTIVRGVVVSNETDCVPCVIYIRNNILYAWAPKAATYIGNIVVPLISS